MITPVILRTDRKKMMSKCLTAVILGSDEKKEERKKKTIILVDGNKFVKSCNLIDTEIPATRVKQSNNLNEIYQS